MYVLLLLLRLRLLPSCRTPNSPAPIATPTPTPNPCHGSPLASKLRAVLKDKCALYGPALCTLVTAYNMEADRGTLETTWAAKQSATFCLEPPGFGPERKAMVDALTLGCIPVLFEPSEEPALWPLQWLGSWKSASRVLVDAREVISGRVDVLATLRAIPAERIAQMQAAIEANVHMVHYGFDDMPGDALDVGLSNLAKAVAA